MLTRFNTNDYVYVEVTPAGWDAMRKRWEGYHINVEDKIEELKQDETSVYQINGKPVTLTRFQLHEAIREFGLSGPCAGDSPFKNCVIYFNSEDLVPVH